MNQQFRTMVRICAIVATGIAFTGIFSVLSLVLMAMSIQKAFEAFISHGVLAALAIMAVPLIIYIIALVTALNFIERKTTV